MRRLSLPRALLAASVLATTSGLALTAGTASAAGGAGTTVASLTGAGLDESYNSLAASGSSQPLPTGVRFYEFNTGGAANGQYVVVT